MNLWPLLKRSALINVIKEQKELEKFVKVINQVKLLEIASLPSRKQHTVSKNFFPLEGILLVLKLM